IAGCAARVTEKMDHLRVADALTEVFALFKRCNKYIDETEPWKLAKDEASADRLRTVLYNLLDGINTGASLLHSFMPETAERILEQIGAELISYDDMASAGNYPKSGRVALEPEILFARLKLEEVMEKIDAQRKAQGLPTLKELAEAEEAAAKAAAEETAAKEEEAEAPHFEHRPECTYDDFMKCEFRIGVIRSCEAVKKSKKLLCSQVDLGDRTVQILSGLRPHYTPEMMVGKKVVVIENLAPRKMAGLESQGMILAAEAPDGTLSVLVPDRADEMTAGAEIS
ncbi:MAG: methionine--tRNA ligase subunit beta, partial [Lachnospiraceae bacterium]|nr:methionine--tRNA ligase subunit beta [Lachnospiraceae bacterium]